MFIHLRKLFDFHLNYAFISMQEWGTHTMEEKRESERAGANVKQVSYHTDMELFVLISLCNVKFKHFGSFRFSYSKSVEIIVRISFSA